MFENKTEKIAKLAEKKQTEKIAKYLNDKDKEVVLAAIKGLGDAGGESGYNALVALLHNPDASIRQATASALGKTGFAQSRTHLSYQLKSETDPAVQASIKSALDSLQTAK